MDERAKRAAENIVAGVLSGGNDVGLVFKPEGELAFVEAIIEAIENEYQPLSDPSVAQLIEEARECVRLLPDGMMNLDAGEVAKTVNQLCGALEQQVVARGEAEKRVEEVERRLRIPCAQCGGPHEFDTSIPSVVWNRIIRASSLPDYLCTTCIVRAFATAGEGFTATLWGEDFNGVPIEVIVNGQNAQDAAAISEENTRLRVRIQELEEVEQMNAVLKYDWLALCGLRESYITALTAISKWIKPIDNGRCGVCRIAFRSYDLRGNPQPCESPTCLSRLLDNALASMIDPPPENVKYQGSWLWALSQMKAGKRVRRTVWPLTSWLAHAPYVMFGGHLIELTNEMQRHGNWGALVEDFEATDWQLTDSAPTGESEGRG